MKENTKKYLKELVDDLEIQINTIDFELNDLAKTKRKLKKIYNNVINNY